MTFGSRTKSWRLHGGLVVTAIFCSAAAQAQSPAVVTTPVKAAAPQNLQQVFEAAWARQPEALTLPSRRDAARAQQSAAQAWTPEPAALEMGYKTDRLNRNQGASEIEVGVSVPLWLPRERAQSAALSDAEAVALESRTMAAKLRIAATVREAWWQWQRARIEVDIARDQLKNTQQIAADVERRTKAGDLARSDQHQAQGAVAGAQAHLAQAEASFAAARQQLQALAGAAPVAGDFDGGGVEQDPSTSTAQAETHAAVQELKDKVVVAERSAALTAIQSRANPELTLTTTRDRSAFGEASQQTFALSVRIPFGGGARHNARTAQALADAMEVQAQLGQERERLAAEQEAARVRVEAARTQLAAAEQRASLARESRGFFDKSFRLGETDLPTRLRIEAEAAEAERQVALVRIELAAAISTKRQTLGLLPQ